MSGENENPERSRRSRGSSLRAAFECGRNSRYHALSQKRMTHNRTELNQLKEKSDVVGRSLSLWPCVQVKRRKDPNLIKARRDAAFVVPELFTLTEADVCAVSSMSALTCKKGNDEEKLEDISIAV
ncbi:hypothetical protein EYF80_003502 [Liparis tanakae]|uniref:Uncharacterized protein n=1 Tax=Liparis tanakae TaxID=230148 RepID=A0A4Z2J6U3_9TELE|nr:hypothetical protein EYF80_003502 [Liparis tanakae]